jgi:hypothetical protein
VNELRNGVKAIQDGLSDKSLRDICTWLELFNPSSSHNDAVKVREENTCRWILRQQEWLDWIAGTRRAIWIHGIPGAGKTILASFINEHIESHCATESGDTIHIYFYLSYRTPGDQTMAFLGWLLGQLCRHRKDVPLDIQHLHHRNVTPKILDLIRAVKFMLDSFDLVYLVIDAIDECNNREELLSVLSIILTDDGFVKVRLLSTSRDYADIRNTMEPLSAQLSMSNSIVSEDISVYIEEELRRDPKLSRWPLALRTEIAKALVEGAKGMYESPIPQSEYMVVLIYVGFGGLHANWQLFERKGQSPKSKPLLSSFQRPWTRHTCELYVRYPKMTGPMLVEHFFGYACMKCSVSR